MAQCAKLETCQFYQSAFDGENIFATRLKQIYCIDRVIFVQEIL